MLEPADLTVPALRALVYTRVSQDDTGAGRSVAEQRKECEATCARNGGRVAGVETDNDRSASRYSKKERPAWQRVKERIATGSVDVLVVWEASRAQRDLAEFVTMRDLCRRHGVLLSYSGRLFDFDDPDDSFTSGLDALLGERESDVTRKRIMRAMRANAEAGRPHGRKLYGYRRVYDPSTGALVGQEPEPAEAAVVRELAERFLAGDSLRSLADDLNRRSVPSATGAGWHPRAVSRLLANPAMSGLRVHQGRVVGEAQWQPIVDRATFEAIQAKFADPSRTTNRGRRDVKWLLSGIAQCSVCGSKLYKGAESRPRADGTKRRIYWCRAEGSGHVVVGIDDLDRLVVDVVLERLRRPDALAALVPDPDDPEHQRARNEAAELRRRLDEAVAETTAGRLSAAMLGRIEQQLLPLIEGAEARARPRPVPAAVLGELAGARDVRRRWRGLSIERKREVVRALAEVAVRSAGRGKPFDPERVTITWR